jgi:carotenoid cleavage dioxygenase-like enzyme
VVKYDLATGSVTEHDLGGDRIAGEAVFVPADGATSEDDGWLLSVVSDRSGRGSELLVLDAADVAGDPVASITLPRRVPVGFHGSWIADPELAR